MHTSLAATSLLRYQNVTVDPHTCLLCTSISNDACTSLYTAAYLCMCKDRNPGSECVFMTRKPLTAVAANEHVRMNPKDLIKPQAPKPDSFISSHCTQEQWSLLILTCFTRQVCKGLPGHFVANTYRATPCKAFLSISSLASGSLQLHIQRPMS